MNDLAVWPWLVGLALALFLADVAARRLRFSAGGLVTPQTVGRPPEDDPVVVVDEPPQQPATAPPPEPERTEALDRLMRRRRR